MYPKYGDLPRTWIINDTLYTVKFKRKIYFEGCEARGLCDPETLEIQIAYGLDREELLQTLIHELLHCIEYEYDAKIPHPLIYLLEGPITKLIYDNFLK